MKRTMSLVTVALFVATLFIGSKKVMGTGVNSARKDTALEKAGD